MSQVKTSAWKSGCALLHAIKNVFVTPSAVAVPAYAYTRRKRTSNQRRAGTRSQGR